MIEREIPASGILGQYFRAQQDWKKAFQHKIGPLNARKKALDTSAQEYPHELLEIGKQGRIILNGALHGFALKVEEAEERIYRTLTIPERETLVKIAGLANKGYLTRNDYANVLVNFAEKHVGGGCGTEKKMRKDTAEIGTPADKLVFGDDGVIVYKEKKITSPKNSKMIIDLLKLVNNGSKEEPVPRSFLIKKLYGEVSPSVAQNRMSTLVARTEKEIIKYGLRVGKGKIKKSEAMEENSARRQVGYFLEEIAKTTFPKDPFCNTNRKKVIMEPLTDFQAYAAIEMLFHLSKTNNEVLAKFGVIISQLDPNEVIRLRSRVRAILSRMEYAARIHLSAKELKSAVDRFKSLNATSGDQLDSYAEPTKSLLKCFALVEIKDGFWEELFLSQPADDKEIKAEIGLSECDLK